MKDVGVEVLCPSDTPRSRDIFKSPPSARRSERILTLTGPSKQRYTRLVVNRAPTRGVVLECSSNASAAPIYLGPALLYRGDRALVERRSWTSTQYRHP